MTLIKLDLVILHMNRLRELREDRDWTQPEVAEKIGVHFTTISRYELGTNDLTAELIGKFCDLYGVTSDYLLCRSNQPRASVSESDTAILAAYHSAPLEIRKIIDAALAPYMPEEGEQTSAS